MPVNHGDGAYAKGQLKQTVPATFTHQAACDPSGWYGEETLDVEAVHAMAPGANIHYYGAASCYDEDLLDRSSPRWSIRTQVQIVTNSYGEPGRGGDHGRLALTRRSSCRAPCRASASHSRPATTVTNWRTRVSSRPTRPRPDPYVTAVGGTSTGINASGKISLNTGWGTEKYSLSADGKSWSPARLPVRRRRRLLDPVQPTRLPERCGARVRSGRVAPFRTSPWTPIRPPAC